MSAASETTESRRMSLQFGAPYSLGGKYRNCGNSDLAEISLRSQPESLAGATQTREADAQAGTRMPLAARAIARFAGFLGKMRGA